MSAMANTLTTILVIVALIAFWLLLPAKYDPAIRWMEWLERRRR